MKKILAGVVLFAASTVLAADLKPIPPVEFTDTHLDNGLRVIIAEDHHAPVYAIAVSYKVGSKDERPGRTGFAHLFEHMMFKGSENVGDGEHFYLVYNNGGTMNGTTNNDRTIYYETLPANQLDLGLFLEADRMRSLRVTQENLDNQRQAVKEERRLRVDNQPYGKTYERLDELAYDAFPYHHSVIGSMEDLDAATVDDVLAFFKTYYAPNNAVLALVGDLNTDEALAKVKKYFGSIEPHDAPGKVDFSQPEQKAERSETLDDPFARLDAVDFAYRIPDGDSSEMYALRMLNSILANGRSSRLYQKMITDTQIAQSIDGLVDDRIGPGLFYVEAILRPGKSTKEAEELVAAELNRFREEPVSAAELQRARTSARRSAVRSRTNAMARARALADYAALYDDPNRINTDLDKLQAVTAEQIQAVARKYLAPTNRTVIITDATGGQRRPRPADEQQTGSEQ